MNLTIDPIADSQPEDAHDAAFGLEVQLVDFLSGYTIPGIIEGFTPGEVTVSLSEMVSEQRAVTVHLNAFIFGGQTLYCRPKGGAYEAHITIDDVEKNGLRRTPRFPVRFPAQMFPSQGTSLDIMIVDISGAGLGLVLPVPVETGQTIALASGSVFVFAIVRYCCAASDGGFRVGVDMQHLFERSSEAPLEEPRAGLLGKVFGKRPAARRAASW